MVDVIVLSNGFECRNISLSPFLVTFSHSRKSNIRSLGHPCPINLKPSSPIPDEDAVNTSNFENFRSDPRFLTHSHLSILNTVSSAQRFKTPPIPTSVMEEHPLTSSNLSSEQKVPTFLKYFIARTLINSQRIPQFQRPNSAFSP